MNCHSTHANSLTGGELLIESERHYITITLIEKLGAEGAGSMGRLQERSFFPAETCN